jgi:hypothetical protein
MRAFQSVAVQGVLAKVLSPPGMSMSMEWQMKEWSQPEREPVARQRARGPVLLSAQSIRRLQHR